MLRPKHTIVVLCNIQLFLISWIFAAAAFGKGVIHSLFHMWLLKNIDAYLYLAFFVKVNPQSVECLSWKQIWPKFYHCNCCAVCTIVSYITAICRESVVVRGPQTKVCFSGAKHWSQCGNCDWLCILELLLYSMSTKKTCNRLNDGKCCKIGHMSPFYSNHI